MPCNNFKRAYLVDGECKEMGGECVPDICENWCECISCQKQAGFKKIFRQAPRISRKNKENIKLKI